MADLFQGTPQTATSYSSSTSETPKWMQDAIYNQIQLAQNVATTPYQPYNLPTVAQLSPLQQQAYQNVQANQGQWSPWMDAVQTAMAGVAQSPGTADALQKAQEASLNPELAKSAAAAGQDYFGQAAGVNVAGAGAGYLDQASKLVSDSMGHNSLDAANPYLRAASGTSVQNIGQYMNPYDRAVTDQIATLGARNLSENLLPAVSDQFVKAGQFGGSRMGEFGSRALRDTQASVLNQQAQALQSGYGQALSASQNDLSRQGQLASTAGNLSGADISRQLQGASQVGQLASSATSAAAQAQQGLAGLGQSQANIAQAQQQMQLAAAQQAQQAQAADYQRQMGALGQIAGFTQQKQAMGAADVASLEGAGAAQQGQEQAQLNAAQTQYQNELNYPKQQLDWLSTQVRGMAPITPTSTTNSGGNTGATYSASPLSQIATGLSAYKGLSALGG
jgi:hypothetical protein